MNYYAVYFVENICHSLLHAVKATLSMRLSCLSRAKFCLLLHVVLLLLLLQFCLCYLDQNLIEFY